MDCTNKSSVNLEIVIEEPNFSSTHSAVRNRIVVSSHGTSIRSSDLTIIKSGRDCTRGFLLVSSSSKHPIIKLVETPPPPCSIRRCRDTILGAPATSSKRSQLAAQRVTQLVTLSLWRNNKVAGAQRQWLLEGSGFHVTATPYDRKETGMLRCAPPNLLPRAQRNRSGSTYRSFELNNTHSIGK